MIKLVNTIGKNQQWNDCSVRALMSLSGKTYEESVEIMRAVGRADNKGVKFGQVLEAYRCIQAKWTGLCNSKPTFNQWYKAADHSKNYAVIVRGHIFAVRKGVVYGNYDDHKRIRARVCQFAEVAEFEAPKIKTRKEVLAEEKSEFVKTRKEISLAYIRVYGKCNINGKHIVAKYYANDKDLKKAIDNAVRSWANKKF